MASLGRFDLWLNTVLADDSRFNPIGKGLTSVKYSLTGYELLHHNKSGNSSISFAEYDNNIAIMENNPSVVSNYVFTHILMFHNVMII